MAFRTKIGSIAAAASLISTAAGAVQYQVYGDIGIKWQAMGGSAGPLGDARSSEADAANGGRFNAFSNGFIYWHPSIGAHAVYGLIGEKWNALGRERNTGYPVTDELAGPRGGRYNDFERNATISWHPRTGAHIVYGLIRQEWLRTGREGGLCGYPTSDEYDYGRGRRSNFEKGFISWTRGAPTARAHCAVMIDQGTALNPVHE